jgi:hypothetical protein
MLSPETQMPEEFCNQIDPQQIFLRWPAPGELVGLQNTGILVACRLPRC